MPRPKKPATALDFVMKSLAAREQTAFQLREKLARKEFPAAEIDAALEKVVELGFLSDERWLENWLRERAALRPAGKRQLLFLARRAGISEELFEKGWEAAELEESQLARAAAESFLRRKGGADREKLARHLAGRGFGWGEIREVLGEQGL